MLIKAKSLSGNSLLCFDGEIGTVKEFYFDDHQWTIRYLIADTGNWLTGRQVLISPQALIAVGKESQYIAINLTKKQIEDSPPLDSDKPVSRLFEKDYYGYYEELACYDRLDIWSSGADIEPNQDKLADIAPTDNGWNPNLRSTKAANGYSIQAIDGEIGHVEDFVIDDETWEIRYLIIDTRNWWLGKKVLISPQWIEQVSWIESKVFVNLRCEDIKLSPEYTDESLLTREYENGLHHHYNRQGYRVDKPTMEEITL